MTTTAQLKLKIKNLKVMIAKHSARGINTTNDKATLKKLRAQLAMR